MLDRIIGFIEGRQKPAPSNSEEDLRVSVAALLVEAARMDQNFGADERATIAKLLIERFEILPDEAHGLITSAEKRVSDSAQYFPYTRHINEVLRPEEKSEIVRMLWSVAYADGELDPYEDQLIRQVAGLIHVTDRDRMNARKDALARRQG